MAREKGTKNKTKIEYSIGVYQIRNTQNNKVYIGSSKEIEKRWSKHKNMLRKGIHHKSKGTGKVSHLQHAWDKYGEPAFAFEILELCSIESLIERETYWFSKTNQADRYNGSGVLPTTLGFKHSKETRKIMSEKASVPKLHKRKPVEQLDEELNTIAKFDSARMAAASDPFFCEAKISACCRGVRVSHRGFHWRYIEDDLDRIRTYSAKNKARHKCDAEGEIIKTYYTKKELKGDGFTPASVRNVCAGHRKTYKGFGWKNA